MDKQKLDALDELSVMRERITVLEKVLQEPGQRFYKGQPVSGLGWLGEGTAYIGRYSHKGNASGHFIKVDGEMVLVVNCKPDPEAPSLINWIEHDGDHKCPVDNDLLTLTEYQDGKVTFGDSDCKSWRAVQRYAIINQPEWCE